MYTDGGDNPDHNLIVTIWRYASPCGEEHVVIFGGTERTIRQNARRRWQQCQDEVGTCSEPHEYVYPLYPGHGLNREELPF